MESNGSGFKPQRMKTSNSDRQIVPGSKPGRTYRKDKHCLLKSVFRVRSPPWPDQLKKLTIALSKKISSCPKKCKTFFDPNGLWHLFAANYKLKCNKRQFFVDSCESYIFSTGEKNKKQTKRKKIKASVDAATETVFWTI